MMGGLKSHLKTHWASVCLGRGDQVTLAVCALLAMGGLTLAQAWGEAAIAPSAATAPAFIIDPNTATEAELLLLPRVGPSLAHAILAERAKGPFENPRDVGRTRGIGEKTLEKLLPHLQITSKESSIREP